MNKMTIKGIRLLMILALGLLIAACNLDNKVSKAKTIELKNRILYMTKNENKALIGKIFYAGLDAKKFSFDSAERTLLKSIEISSFTCKKHDPKDEKVFNKDTWCHFYGNFHMKNGKGKLVHYKKMMKVRIQEDALVMPSSLFRITLLKGFTLKNPFRMKRFTRHFQNLRRGRLAIGMPDTYLKLVWGQPQRVVDFSITELGRTETYVYNRYFVLLKNRKVDSIHKFDDLEADIITKL